MGERGVGWLGVEWRRYWIGHLGGFRKVVVPRAGVPRFVCAGPEVGFLVVFLRWLFGHRQGVGKFEFLNFIFEFGLAVLL